MKKKSLFKNPSFYYWLFVALASLELIISFFGIFINFSDRSRDASIANVFLSILAIILMSIPRFLKEKYHFRFRSWIEILILIFLFASIILGFIQEFYENVSGYDKLVHIISGIVLSLVAFEFIHIYSNYIAKKKNQTIPPLFTVLFSFTLSITLLVLWEFYEFIADTISYNFFSRSTNMQRYMWANKSNFFPQNYGLIDTMLDLILGALGSFVISIVLFFILKKHEKESLEASDLNKKE